MSFSSLAINGWSMQTSKSSRSWSSIGGQSIDQEDFSFGWTSDGKHLRIVTSDFRICPGQSRDNQTESANFKFVFFDSDSERMRIVQAVSDKKDFLAAGE